jgi:hypothetical protein
MVEKKQSGKEGFVKIPNPYRAYDIESGNWFYHKDLIEKIKSEFSSNPPRKTILIHGMIGSGKTSSLKRMVKNPQLLGRKYLPIYMKSSDIALKDAGVLLKHFYIIIKESLTKLGIKTDEANHSFTASISLEEIKTFINSLKIKYGMNDYIIVLIIDEFEKMEQEILLHSMSKLFEFFNYILHEHDIFRVILAGKFEILKSTKDIEIKKLLYKALKIELGMYLDTIKIKKLIEQPVAGKLEYEPEALEEIIRVTGRNLYCQQLLCYYIVEYLNEKKKNVCTLSDVNHEVNRALSDIREDFIYFWNKLSYESKILHAGLADENVIKKEGEFYYIQDSFLLNSILGENRVKDTLDRSFTDQHIHKIDGKRFENYPFKIPLYGEWLKRNHTLTKTIAENWDVAIENVTLSNLGKILEIIPAGLLYLEKQTIKNTIELSKKWSSVKNSLGHLSVDDNLVKDLVHMICDILEFKITKEPNNGKHVFALDSSRLNLIGVKNVLLFAVPKEELTENDIECIHDSIMLEDRPSNPSFVLCLKKSENIQELTRRQYLGIVLINEKDLIRCVLSPTPTQVFKRDVLIKQIKPSAISPYKTEGPVRTTFYGRHVEIGRILGKNVRNFAIVGARKIGKTSLLFKIISSLPKNIVPVYLGLDSPEVQNYTTFLTALQDKLSEEYKKKININYDLSNCYPIIKKLNQSGKKPMLFIDEIDKLIKFDEDNNFKLLSIFRSLAQEQYCQLIISGFKGLSLIKKKLESPLYNFLEFITLDKLKKQDALDLITEPMRSIGIRYGNDIDRNLILEYTSHHPNLLQFLCKKLVEAIPEREEEKFRRTISAKDIKKVYESFDYEKYVINDFYLFFTDDIDPIERLIVLLLAEKYPYKKTFTTTEIIKALEKNGIHLSLVKLADYSANLILRYIFLEEKSGLFRFALPIFPKMLRERDDFEYLIDQAKNEAKEKIESGDKTNAKKSL